MKVKAGCLIVVFTATAISAALVTAQESRSPRYDLDRAWPKVPLRNRWVLGQIGNVCLDSRDHVFAVNRGVTDDTDLDGGINAPPVIEFDPEGNIVNGWGDRAFLGAGLHDCHIDKDDNIWIIANSGSVKKFTREGRFLLQLEGVPGSHSLASDPQNGDLYLADYGDEKNVKPRVAVMDRTGKFLRAFPLNRTTAESDLPQVPHCLGFSNDGFVYVCDRDGFRVQVFDRMGRFIKNINVPWKPYTPPAGRKESGGTGSASGLDFSRDAKQEFLFTTNEDNSQVEVLDRNSGRHLGSFGYGAGHFPGQFTHLHGIGVDSKGNIYTSETGGGMRVQRWRIAP
jgi:hypothetical protein